MKEEQETVCCYNCGFEYDIDYTEQYSKDNVDNRICFDCIEGDIDYE